jgi:hypothetical protein
MKNMIGFLGVGFIILLFIIPNPAFSEPKLTWDTSSGQVDGYRIYYGTTQGTYSSNKDVGKVTEYSLANLSLQERKTYYFIARAYNSAGESGDSNWISWKVPDSTAPAPVQSVDVE